MRKFSATLALVLLLSVLQAALASASQPEYPALVGSVADSTGRITGSTAIQKLSDVQAAIDQLAIARKAVVYALLYNHKGGLSSDRFEEEFMVRNGLGEIDRVSGQFFIRSDVIIIAVDFENMAPGGITIKIRAGDNFRSLAGRIQSIQDENVGPQLRENTAKAFINGFEAINKALEPVDYGKIIGTIGMVLVIIFMFWLAYSFFSKWLPAIIRKLALIKEVEELIVSVSRAADSLVMKLPQDGSPSLGVLRMAYFSEKPDKAAEISGQYNQAYEKASSIWKRTGVFRKDNFGLFSESTRISSLKAKLQELQKEQNGLLAWLKGFETEASEIEKIISMAPDNVAANSEAIKAAAEDYEKARTESSLLPEIEKAIQTVRSLQSQSEEKVKNMNPLSAVELAEQTEQAINAFTCAFLSVAEAERTITQTRGELNDAAKPFRPRVAEVEAITASLTEKLRGAVDLLIQGRYQEACDLGDAVVSGCIDAKGAVNAFADGLKIHDETLDIIGKIQKRGFRLAVQKELSEVRGDIEMANKALEEADFEAAMQWIRELGADSDRSREVMERLASLHDSNNERLKVLSIHVAGTEKYRTETISPLWQNLKNGFRVENWNNVGPNFETAAKLIKGLFDDPADLNDLASNISRLNSLDTQEFEEAEHLLDRAENDYARAKLLLEQIEAQHDKAVGAKKNFKAALEKAASALQTAREERDDSDELTDVSVDNLISDAEQALASAKESAKEEVYVDVMGFCEQVQSMCDEAVSDIGKQVAFISQAIKDKNSLKNSVMGMYDDVESAVKGFTRAAISRETYDLLSAATTLIQEASAYESKALTLQDTQRLHALEECSKLFRRALNSIEQARKRYENDVEAYNKKFAEATDAVEDAAKAIRSAERECGDYRAGSSGESALSRARSLLPSRPSTGTSYGELERMTDDAKMAKNEAENAEKQAEEAVREHNRRTERSYHSSHHYGSGGGGSHGSGSSGISASRSSFGGGVSSSRSGF